MFNNFHLDYGDNPGRLLSEIDEMPTPWWTVNVFSAKNKNKYFLFSYFEMILMKECDILL